ncbi:MAG: transposase [Verrucomicrobiota bacterium]
MQFIPFDRDVRTLRWQRNLPHWEQPGGTYFVTFRLADSIPKAKWKQWVGEKEEWMIHHSAPWSDREWKVYREQFLQRIERWSDRGYGDCLLGDPEVREIVNNSLLFFDADGASKDGRYELGDFVIMPNHVHLLVKPVGKWNLGQLIHSWKSFSAHAINKYLSRTGSLWMDERFDHLVRSVESLHHYRLYVQDNPRKAGLQANQFTLHRSA